MGEVILSEVDSLMAELGLDLNGLPKSGGVVPPPNASAGPGMNRGPGPMGMSGPGANRGLSSGPGAMRGVSSGPGANRGFSSGPGASRGPGSMSGPGVGFGQQVATHTPDGRELKWNGPPCAACGEMVIGPVINAMDKSWHPDHFICANCNKPFPGGNFVEQDDKPYCDDCYSEFFGPRCHTCLKPIADKCINACGRVYHPEHFFCNDCGTELRGKPFREDDGEPFCLTCKAARQVRINPVGEICAKCKRPIIGEYITLHGQKMHPEHFRCEECGCEFTGGNSHEYEGKLYCYMDYLKMLKSTCAHCQKPIVGRSVTAIGKVWHPEHFMCYTCKEPFQGMSFFEKDGRAYCELHYHQQFGKVCFKCNKAIIGEGIAALGRHYHPDHFICTGCNKPLGKEITEWDGKPLCGGCFGKLPKEVRKKIEQKKQGERKALAKRQDEHKKESRNRD
eukprot:TRINITY_DN1478_c0_g1_i2.p1 TRINITY_DN1478_c0_g1~~TRINITY_DN1478_c0_g1_i2.p1  ORF type:complete len:450 (-),score=81.48 TRINITY_DN1478_c0_g1_i2:268-1617(-)